MASSVGLRPANAVVAEVHPTGERPESAAAPRWGRLGGFALVAAQLALLLVIVRLFDIAGRNHFFPVLCIAVGGYLVHAWLPARWRASFFCALSLGGILFVLGWPNGGYVLGIGAGLIALCHLPVPFALRVAVVVFAGLLLALFRLDYDYPFWTVLGSMFMFRLIVYLHDLRHYKGGFSPPVTVAYFFPLPNVSFLFFPILDFKTFRETYEPGATWEAAQGGVGWIAQGLSQLLLYRVIKYYWLPSPHELGDMPHLLLFLATNYALYLHVSGYFHVITGVFHLFGFRLPRTHHNYFLASSFTDIWRRINIYWKDFMAKVFFFPAFFALRGWGTRPAAVVAALGVFLATWLLHSYQVFWITGSLPLAPRDAVLWLVVGVLVAWNLQRDLHRAERRRTPRRAPGPFAAIGLAARVVGMFVLVSFFWACWNTPMFLGYLRAQVSGDARWLSGWGWVLGVLLTAVAVGAVVQLVRARLLRTGVLPLRVSPVRSGVALTLLLAAVAAVGSPRVAAQLGGRAAGVLAALRNDSATPLEAAQAVQGYYEEIADAPVRAGSWLAALEGHPTPPHIRHYEDMSRFTDELIGRELIPNWSGDVEGHRLTVNRFGLRDRPNRTREKPPDTYRVAFVGSSVVMGYGVADDATFPRLVEEQLNAGRTTGPRYELVNFGMGRSNVIQRRVLIDRRVWAFQPDAIYYVAHQDELLASVNQLSKVLSSRTPLPYPCLQDVARKAGITPDTPPAIIEARLQPLARDIVLGLYRDLVAECRRRGVKPVWIYLPMPGVVEVSSRSAEFVQLAEEAGFAVVNLADWADGRRPAEVRLGELDHHANTLGHRIIADRLAEALRRRPELLSNGNR